MPKRPRPVYCVMDIQENEELPACKVRKIFDHVGEELRKIRRKSESDTYNRSVRKGIFLPKSNHDFLDQIMFKSKTVEEHANYFMQYDGHQDETEHANCFVDTDDTSCATIVKKESVSSVKSPTFVFGKGSSMYNPIVVFDGEQVDFNDDGVEVGDTQEEHIEIINLDETVDDDTKGTRTDKGHCKCKPSSEQIMKGSAKVDTSSEVKVKKDTKELTERYEPVLSITFNGSKRQVKSHIKTVPQKCSGMLDKYKENTGATLKNETAKCNELGKCNMQRNPYVSVGAELKTDHRDKIYQKTNYITAASEKPSSHSLDTRRIQSKNHTDESQTSNQGEKQNCRDSHTRKGTCEMNKTCINTENIRETDKKKENRQSEREVQKFTSGRKARQKCLKRSKNIYNDKKLHLNNLNASNCRDMHIGKENCVKKDSKTENIGKNEKQKESRLSGREVQKSYTGRNDTKYRHKRWRWNPNGYKDKQHHFNNSANFFSRNPNNAWNQTDMTHRFTAQIENRKIPPFHYRERRFNRIEKSICWHPLFCVVCGTEFRFRHEFLSHIRKFNHCPFEAYDYGRVETYLCSYCPYDSKTLFKIMLHYFDSHALYFKHNGKREVLLQALCKN